MHVFWKLLIVGTALVGAIGFMGLVLWIREIQWELMERHAVPDKLEPEDNDDITAGYFV